MNYAWRGEKEGRATMKKRVKKTDINAYILELKKEIIDIAGWNVEWESRL